MPRIEFRVLNDGSGQKILTSLKVPSIHISADSERRTVIQVPPEIANSLKEKIGEVIGSHPKFILNIRDGEEEGQGGNLFYQHTTFFPNERTIGRFTSSVVAPEDIEPYIDDTIRDEYDREEQNSPLVSQTTSIL